MPLFGSLLRDDTDLDDGWTRAVGESDVGTAHKVELGLSLALRASRQIAEGGVKVRRLARLSGIE